MTFQPEEGSEAQRFLDFFSGKPYSYLTLVFLKNNPDGSLTELQYPRKPTIQHCTLSPQYFPQVQKMREIELVLRSVMTYLGFDQPDDETLVGVLDSMHEELLCDFQDSAQYLTDEAPAPPRPLPRLNAFGGLFTDPGLFDAQGNQPWRPSVFFGFTAIEHVKYLNYLAFKNLYFHEREIVGRFSDSDIFNAFKNRVLRARRTRASRRT